MEAIAVLGVAGSIVGMMDVIGRTVFKLHDVYRKFKEANITLTMLIAELTTTKAALSQISAWIDEKSADDEAHYFQLTIDLENSLTASSYLINLIDSQVTKLTSFEEHSTAGEFQRKVETVLSDAETTRYLEMLNRQVSVLNLLITTFNCRTTEQRKVVLENKQNRKLFDQVHDDSSSLRVLYDGESFVTGTTETTRSSKFALSLRLPGIDNQLLETRVYQNSYRALMRFKAKIQTAREDKKSGSELKRIEQMNLEASKSVNQSLAPDNTTPSKIVNVLICGPLSDSGTIIRRLLNEKFTLGDTIEYFMAYREPIFRFVVNSMQNLINLMNNNGITIGEELHMFVQTVLSENSQSEEFCLSQKTADAIKYLWSQILANTDLEKFWEKSFPFAQSACYFFSEVDRLAQEEYIPSRMDVIVMSTIKEGTLTEIHVPMGVVTVNLIQSNQWTEPKKWFHYCENTMSIIFVVDLCSYDTQWFNDRLTLFETVVSSRCFLRTSLTLLLDNSLSFRKKIEAIPLAEYFPDYSGGCDVNLATQYILWRFNQLNRSGLELYPLLTDPSDSSLWKIISAFLRETVLQRALIDSKIIDEAPNEQNFGAQSPESNS